MKALGIMTAVGIALIACMGVAAADPWKDESDNGRWLRSYERGDDYWRGGGHRYNREGSYKRAYKEEYRRGRCKIERKWDDDEYKEEIKCKRGGRRPV
ncbi:hypothetical protein [Mesorhizobium delmotii]|uniref:Putative secreted protein n=1 Tax=Mesorhizobium delmotii TaxID=1631247 RepID=A0A2P9AEX7_9HYPH|nr:hypothetical protein [Mesorhizobium delmotii]SJM29693.1 putative secreted protein [Mesorhizobium delmotii]